ncbi:MAG TPA: diguanylate cyclase [Bryobacteraceae bacterium]|nr:diguanylate cyclase [Bryobacteraceae bacterium]
MRSLKGTAVISIRKSVSDLDRLDEMRKRDEITNRILDCYALAIQSAAHYAVDVDPLLAAEHRARLQTLEDKARAVASEAQLRDVQSSLRGELRDYRERNAEVLKKIHQELENAAAAMMIFADTVAANGTNHEHEVNAQLRRLESTSHGTHIEEMRAGIGAAIENIQSSIQQMQRGNQLIVSQLQDEIRILHQQIDAERKALCTDRASGAWNRQKMEQHIDNLLGQNQPFCLLLVWVRNYKRLESQFSRNVLENTLKALFTRLAAIAGHEAVIGRWREDQFVAVLDLIPGHAISLTAEVNRKLSGGYSVQENGLAQKVAVQAVAGVVDRLRGVDGGKFREKLDQLSIAISGA